VRCPVHRLIVHGMSSSKPFMRPTMCLSVDVVNLYEGSLKIVSVNELLLIAQKSEFRKYSVTWN